MHRVQFDRDRNLVHIQYSGHVTPDDGEQLRREAVALLDRVDPGFRLLADLSLLEEMDIECAPGIRGVMDDLREHGVVQIVRVIPDHWKDIGFATMSQFHYRSNVSMQTVETMDEAARLLQN